MGDQPYAQGQLMINDLIGPTVGSLAYRLAAVGASGFTGVTRGEEGLLEMTAATSQC